MDTMYSQYAEAQEIQLWCDGRSGERIIHKLMGFNRREDIESHAAKFGVNWDEHLHHLLFAYRTKPHKSTGESPFFLLYGRDARIPCEATLSTPRTAYQIDMDDYKTELMDGLSTAWELV